MHLDGRLLYSIFAKEVGNLGALIPLELDDLSHFLIVDESSVASEFLFKGLQKFFGIILFRQALQSGQRFSPIPLLNTDVDVV